MPPIIAISTAYANPNVAGYLPEARKEAIEVERLFREFSKASNVDTDVRALGLENPIEVERLCQDHPDDIVILHFTGHADGTHLQFGEGMVLAEGLAESLKEVNNLGLVFLNGCRTRDQITMFFDAGVPCVVATNCDIKDSAGRKFAGLFYTYLTIGYSIHGSFRKAVGQLRWNEEVELNETTRGFAASNERNDVYWALEVSNRNNTDASFAKWWTLDGALNQDGHVGLPAIRPDIQYPPLPFKGLSFYREQDARVFFGRNSELKKLFNFLESDDHRVLLYYGQSGVGKSSILNSGLISRLKEEYCHSYIRTYESKFDGSNFQDRDLVILDQAEEVITLRSSAYSADPIGLANAIKSILEQDAKVKFIVSFRKEYVAEFVGAFNAINVTTAKCFVESLNKSNVAQILAGIGTPRMGEVYNLKVDEELGLKVAYHLESSPESPIAPTIQLMLTNMYDYTAKESTYSSIPLTVDIFNHVVDKSGIYLNDYLRREFEQMEQCGVEPVEIAEKSGLILEMLLTMTTPAGTAKAVDLTTLVDRFGPDSKKVLIDLENRYIVVSTGVEKGGKKRFQLAHDTLVSAVLSSYNASTRPGQLAKRILKLGTERIKLSQDG